MNETLSTIWRRQSIRSYQADPIPDEHLYLILETARRAPTGSNRQRWQMVVVTDVDLRRRTAEACSHQMWMADAPVILCLVTLPGESKVNGTIVLDHAILAATSLGYGTCWIGAYDEGQVKAVLNIPETYGIVCLTPVGVPAEKPAFRPRKPAAELFAQDQFGLPLDYQIETESQDE
ncbi:MAG: nitroreductase family protein [Anaerolineae bacterium]|nr:nitroreductase family protein [Anaerolineae bacterium]